MAELTLQVTKPNRRIHQVGDNDSGRFLNLQPIYIRLTTAEAKARFANLTQYDDLPDAANYWAEDHLDHRSLVAAIGGSFDRADFVRFCGPGRIETPLIRQLIGGTGLASCLPVGVRPQAAAARVGGETKWQELQSLLASNRRLRRYAWRVTLPDAEIVGGLEQYAYPDFGLFVWRSRRLYLAARCGPRRHSGHGGHAHNDQLAIELTVDGRDLLVDPGTYLYTADPQRRNAYRSVAAHCAPQPSDGREPGRFDLNLFALRDAARAQCLYFGPRGFAGTHRGYGHPIYRTIVLEPAAIVVTDYADRSLTLRNLLPGRSTGRYQARLPVCAGYGIAVRPNLELSVSAETAETLLPVHPPQSPVLRIDASMVTSPAGAAVAGEGRLSKEQPECFAILKETIAARRNVIDNRTESQ
jgi:hypothetical protein